MLDLDTVAPPSPALVARIAATATRRQRGVVGPGRILALLWLFVTGAGVAYAQARNASEIEHVTLSTFVYGLSAVDGPDIGEDLP